MKYLIFFVTLLLSGTTQACSCAHDRSLNEVAKKSKAIFYAEVIGIVKIGPIVSSGNQQDYEITVYPTKVIKGKAKARYKFRGTNYYNNTASEEVTIGGCGLSAKMGDKVIILYEPRAKIRWSWCSEHVLPEKSKKYEKIIELYQKSTSNITQLKQQQVGWAFWVPVA